MWDVFLKIAFYTGSGIALIAAFFWYASSLYTTLTSGDVVIAPFEVIGADGKMDKDRGTGLARLLQAQLRQIERDVDSAQDQIKGTAPEVQQTALAPRPANIKLPRLRGVGLQTRLLNLSEFKISVGGVEVGGIIAWVQRKLIDPRTVTFTLYERKAAARVAGALKPLGLGGDALNLQMGALAGEESVPLDRVVETMAYEIMWRLYALDAKNELQALNRSEFQSLVDVLRRTAMLNLQLSRGHSLPADIDELSDEATALSDSVENWRELAELAAGIAQSAENWEGAQRLYERALKGLNQSSEQARELKARIEEVQAKADADQAATAPQNLPAEALDARAKMQAHVQEAVAYYNRLLDQNLPTPVVKIQTDKSLKYSPYWDSKNVVASEDVQFIPDVSFRDASWQHIFAIVPSFASDKNDVMTDIMYSYADVFTMLAQQQHLHQNEKTSEWVLHKGFIDWTNGKTPTKPYEGTPLVSFSNPGKAYQGDTQVAHMKDYVRSPSRYDRRYINSGIFNKGFYLVATKLGANRAAEIWITGLRQLASRKQINAPSFGKILYSSAGKDRDVAAAALHDIGLDVAATASATH